MRLFARQAAFHMYAAATRVTQPEGDDDDDDGERAPSGAAAVAASKATQTAVCLVHPDVLGQEAKMRALLQACDSTVCCAQ